jgi:hypothetical protein
MSVVQDMAGNTWEVGEGMEVEEDREGRLEQVVLRIWASPHTWVEEVRTWAFLHILVEEVRTWASPHMLVEEVRTWAFLHILAQAEARTLALEGHMDLDILTLATVHSQTWSVAS